MSLKIHSIETGTVQIRTLQQVAKRDGRLARSLDVLLDPAWSRPLPIGCWLVEHPEGLLLVDSGESPHVNDPGYLPWWHPFMQLCVRFDIAPEQGVGARIQALGFDPRDVRWLVLTHMHGDHAGGLDQFPRSEIVMSAQEADAALARSGPVNGYLNMHYPDWLNPRRVGFADGPWESFERSTVLTRDGRIRLVPTPGHTDGHLSVVVEQGDHLVFLGGDASYDESSLLAGGVDGVAHNSTRHRQTTERIRGLCRRQPTVTLFAHDPASASRLENGKLTQPE